MYDNNVDSRSNFFQKKYTFDAGAKSNGGKAELILTEDINIQVDEEQ